MATRLANLGVLAEQQGDLARTGASYEESLALFRALGDRRGTAHVLGGLGAAAYWQGDDARAEALYEESLALARELGVMTIGAFSLTYLAHLASRRGDTARATALYQEVLHVCRESGDLYLLPFVLEGMAWARRGQESGERAAQLFGVAEALRSATGAVLAPHERADREQKVQALRELLGQPAFERAWAAGQLMPVEEALALALRETPNPVLGGRGG